MDQFSDPDFGELFEEFAQFASFPLATSLSSTFATPNFGRLTALEPSAFQNSSCPDRRSANNAPRDSLSSESSANRDPFDLFTSPLGTNPRNVGTSSIGSSGRSDHATNPIATPRQPLASRSLFQQQDRRPQPAQSVRFTSVNSPQRPGAPSGFLLPDPDHDFFVNEFLNRDFSSPPPFLHRDPFDTHGPPNIAESSTASATGSSSRSNEDNTGIKREDSSRVASLTNPTESVTTEMSSQKKSGKQVAGSVALPMPQKKRQRTGSFEAKSDASLNNMKTIDLVDTEVIPDDIESETVKKPIIRLGTFSCAVCMDSITNMTALHCGHVFCGECLHLALSTIKMACPLCRQKVDHKRTKDGGCSIRQKGFWVVRMKVGKKKSLGKRVVRDGAIEKK